MWLEWVDRSGQVAEGFWTSPSALAFGLGEMKGFTQTQA